MSTKVLVEKRVISSLFKISMRQEKQLNEFKVLIESLMLELSEKPDNKKEWLTITDIETEFGLSRKIIDGFRKKGLKSNQKIANGKITIRRIDLEKFISKK